MIGEDRRAGSLRRGALQLLGKAVSKKHVVPEDQCRWASAKKIGADDERLSETFGFFLNCVGELDADLRAITEQVAKSGRVGRRADDENLANSGKQNGRQRIIDHRLVVNRNELLAHYARRRPQARSRPAGEDDSFSIAHEIRRQWERRREMEYGAATMCRVKSARQGASAMRQSKTTST